MPTYGYRCPQCGHEYDAFQKMSDQTRAKCPKCGTRGERLITGGAGLVFKGSGFYITDYKRAGEKKEGAEGKDAKEKDAKKKDAKKKDKAEGATGSPPSKSDKSKGAGS